MAENKRKWWLATDLVWALFFAVCVGCCTYCDVARGERDLERYRIDHAQGAR